MAAEIIEMECTNPVLDINEIAANLKKEIFKSADLTHEVTKQYGENTVIMISFEKYYFRNNSSASLTVLLADGETQTADIVGFGGGEGLLNLSWGANADFANKAADILAQYGFNVVS